MGAGLGEYKNRSRNRRQTLAIYPHTVPAELSIQLPPTPTTPPPKQVKQVSSPWWFNTFQLERGDHLWKQLLEVVQRFLCI